MPDNFTFEAANLQMLAEDLRKSALRVRSEVDKSLVVIGGELTAAADKEAKRHSRNIKVKGAPIPGAFVIRATGPLAAPYELGNKGRGGRSKDTFMHPLFGNWDYPQQQKRYPYLRPALTAMRAQVTKRMEEAWERSLRPLKLM